MMKILFYSFFPALLFVSHCFAQNQPAVSVFTANFNDHIDAKSRNEIKLLDNQVIAAFNEGNAQKLFSLYSGDLKKVISEAQTEDFIGKVHPAITSQNYSLLDDYLVTTEAKGVTQTIFKGMVDDYAYKVNFSVVTKETYVSLLIYESGFRQLLFTCIYGKYDDGWKLNTIRVGPYKLLGMNSIDFYKLSKESFGKGDLVQAEIYIQLAQATSLPADKSFVYFKLPEMMEYNRKLAAEANTKIKLPMKIPGVDTTTTVFDIEPIVINEGIFPNVKYFTTIPLSDTVALKAQNGQIKKVIGQVFPGIDKGKKYVFFKAYNKLPDGNKIPIQTFGFVLKNDEK